MRPTTNKTPWRILVVDDEEGIHGITRMIFRGYQFENRSIELISALNGQEAREILNTSSDIALILLDVVMESDDEGLRLVDYVRNTLGNHDIRIILRTGHPGFAPETEVIVDYDINDYLSKAELSASRLLTSVVVALRSFRDIETARKNETTDNVTRSLDTQIMQRLGDSLLPLTEDTLLQSQRLEHLDLTPMAQDLISALNANQHRLQSTLLLLRNDFSLLTKLQVTDIKQLLDQLIQVFIPQARRQGWLLDYRLQAETPSRLRLPAQGVLQLWIALMEYAQTNNQTDIVVKLEYSAETSQLETCIKTLTPGTAATQAELEDSQQWRQYRFGLVESLCLSLGGTLQPEEHCAPGELAVCHIPADAVDN
ncbi:response regulator [Motiliproteus sp. MSK22-1]|uniref:response regulator n=1 Tax=Motiliproteus sp. MSK22-1 TaxID=1897630 RepID=UPI000975C687|nr:response regulator [Motiliproteus sp. MSK22-1]OMH25605.1 hypothetical protein BGP75_23950 [Motiliproteus sp. MSK22-1]